MTADQEKSATNWRFPKHWGLRSIAILILSFMLLWHTGHRVEMDRMAVMTGEAAGAVVTGGTSQVTTGLWHVFSSLWPIQIEERTDVGRIENFDPGRLPLLSRVEIQRSPVQRINPATLQMETRYETHQVLIEPFGYLFRVGEKMLETLEMALWGTLLAIFISAPLAVLAARPYSPNLVTYYLARTIVSLFRAVPEMISALFLVLAYGFGPIAGVLALAFHSAGFFGKFYAEDIENADTGPQEALRAIGTGPLLTLRHAVMPQVLPQYVAYTLYILDRNVRMATVVGLVGAGGIGQELKGRFDMYDYGHIGTILLAIFVVVVLLDQASNRIRSKLFAHIPAD